MTFAKFYSGLLLFCVIVTRYSAKMAETIEKMPVFGDI
jgi:hypothetical protein